VPLSFRLFKSPLAARVPKGQLHAAIRASPEVAELGALATPEVYTRLATRAEGLTAAEAATRLSAHGPNALATERPPSLARLLARAALNPLVVLLATLAVISFFTGDRPAAVIMSTMIALSVSLSLIQERRAGHAAARLRAMISLSATVVRDSQVLEVPVATVVPGDVIHLAAGDMVPGDVRIVQAKDLFVSQGSLTGESFPVEKFSALAPAATTDLIALPTLAFLGTSVESGAAIAVVIATGKATYLGSMAQALGTPAPPTAFDRGIARFTWLMLAFMGVMVPVVFVINGALHGSWAQAFFFAVAVAVGLTPEMLPMIVTVCLSRGAVTMGRKKVIVKRLNAIQNLGAMDVLCTDKTGTLTRDQVTLERHCDVALREDPAVLALGYVNSHFQTGLKNVLDRAILAHHETHADAQVPELTKVDEIPFDFQRRLMSVVVRTPQGLDRLIAKGAPEAIFPRCSAFELDGQRLPMDHEHVAHLKDEYERLSADGFRVLALATKEAPPRADSTHHGTAWGKADETELVLRGYLAFLDPPKESCAEALQALAALGIQVKVVTGDNELVARRVCHDVGLPTEHLLLGSDLEPLTDAQLADAAETTTLFSRVSPAHKERIIKALQSRRHVVGFLGDGINDAPALHAADVGISVDTAVDIAKESADLILLEKSLLVLRDGVREGRKVFVNIAKYVRMGASSSFGNVLSVVGASLFVPFLPMQPIQILANNLLYDLGQTAIPSDQVDDELIAKPRPWDLSQLTRFILFIGPCSSIFDFTTFFVMLYVFHCWDTSTPAVAAASASLFQTGWFIESLLTQTVVIHVIRTRRVPFVQSRASWQVFVMGGVSAALGLGLTLSPLATWLGFRPLPWLYWPILLATLLCYLVLTQLVKSWLFRREWV
jgi:P-type Mg2+ transporter